jgi:amino acid adenylation domain-containing protein
MRKEDNSKELYVAANQNVKTKEYWLRTLAGELVKTGFPYGHTRQDDQQQEGRSQTGIIREEITGPQHTRLDELSNKSGYTLHLVLLSALAVLLNKYTEHDDIIIGTPIYKQEAGGNYVNTELPLRSQISEGQTFRQLLLQVRQQVMDATEHQNYPMEILVDQLKLENDGQHNPLYDTHLQLENIHQPIHREKVKVGVQFSFKRTECAIEVEIRYDARRYEKAAVQGIMNHTRTLMQEVLADVNKPLEEVGILTEVEKKRLLRQYNATDPQYADSTGYPRDAVLHGLYEEQAQKTPDRTALIFEDRQITYGELDKQANRVARVLREKAVTAGVIVGLQAEITIETIIGMIGILKAGAAFLPLPPESPPERIEKLVNDSGLEIIVAAKTESTGYIPGTTQIDIRDKRIPDSPDTPVSNRVQPGDPAYVIYTSGSTGTPKGVIIQHDSIVNQIYGLDRMFYREEKLNHILLAPLTFDPSVQQVFSPIIYGGTLLLISRAVKLEGEQLVKTIRRHRIDIIDAVPSQMSMMIDYVAKDGEKRLALKYIILAGEVFSKSLEQRIKETVTVEKLVNIYGPTEATINSTFHICDEIEDNRAVPIGKPLMNYKIYILNRKKKLLPPGAVGQLFISGVGVARGYLNSPEQTHEKFSPNPFEKDQRIYATGDRARWRYDGNLEFIGRDDHQVKIRGHRIELGEIEKRIAEIDEIKEAVVIDRKDKNRQIMLCAYIVSNETVNASRIKKSLAQKLPDYMIPTSIQQLDTIPLTANDKLDRNALPEPKIIKDDDNEAPRDELEKQLARIWADELGIEIEAIGIDSDFFELGGHSLKATYLVTNIHKKIKAKIPLKEIFRTPNIRGLAEYIRQNGENNYKAIKKAEVKNHYALSSAQKRLYILQQLEKESTAYNMPQAIPMPDGQTPEKIKRIFEKLIHRHEALRTSFEVIDRQPVQKIHDEVEFELEIVEIQEGDLQNRVNAYVKPFELSKAPLFRAALIRSGNTRPVLMVDQHHIISDGISHTILEKEFTALSRGEELPPLKLQYKDYSEWQNQDETREAIKEQGNYWRSQFEGETPTPDIPLDHPRPPIQSFEGGTVRFELEKNRTEAIEEMALKEEATPFMIQLAAYNILLSKLTGQDDIIVGTPVMGRRHADLLNVIGVFVNTLALRNTPGKQKTILEFLQDVKNNTLDAFENQDYPFEELVEKLALKRDTSRNPLFDTMFSYTGQQEELPRKETLDCETVNYENTISKFDLSLAALNTGESIFFTFEYCTKLFEKETVQRFARYYKKILETVIQSPEMKINRLEMITHKEKRQIQEEFNGKKMEYQEEKTVIQQFEEQVKRTPDRIMADYRAHQVTYKTVNQKANQKSAELRAKGVKPGTIVGIMIEPSIEMMIGLIAIQKAGGAYLPMELRNPPKRLNDMLRDAGVCHVLTTRKSIEKQEIETEPIEIIYGDEYGSQYDEHIDKVDPENVNKPQDPIYIIYTSGTSGKPKGVIAEHRNVNAYIHSFYREIEITENDIILQQASIAFDTFTEEIYPVILKGGRIAVPTREEIMDTRLLTDYIDRKSINIIDTSPLMLNELDKLNRLKRRKDGYKFLSGGDVLKYEYIGNLLKYGTVYNTYGPTESTVCGTFYRLEGESAGAVPIGKPIANYDIYILDGDNLQPIGVPGELCIAGPGVARGYLNREELNKEKFTQDPLKPGQRMYRTGDRARWRPDGNIEYMGRIDRQVNIRGYRVETGEIEHRLQHIETIKKVVVLEGERKNGQKYLIAYIVPEEKAAEQQLEVANLREQLARELPDYMIPAYYEIVKELPLTPNGKIDRSRLPKPGEGQPTGRRVAPAGDNEEMIADIWKEVLELEEIGADENFFEIGGTSIDIIQVSNRLKEKTKEEIAVVTLFRYPTIQSLAKHLRKDNETQDSGQKITDQKVTKLKNKMNKTLKIIKKGI